MTDNRSEIAPSELSPNPWNPNRVDPVNLDKLRKSITTDGIAVPVVVRRLDSGVLEILDGEHRVRAAKDLGLATVPVRILENVPDGVAKRITLLGNSRYGENDHTELSRLLNDPSIGSADDLLSMLPIDQEELDGFFSHGSDDFSDLDDLDSVDVSGLDDDDPIDLSKPETRTHKIMRFRVPVEKVELVTSVLGKVRHEQGLNDDDELTNGGEALCFILKSFDHE